MKTAGPRWPRYLALATLLGAMGLLSWYTLAAIDRAPDAAEAKRRGASRVIAYQVFHDRGPVFQTDGGRSRLKLVTDAVIDGAYDPGRATSYGIRLIVNDGDRVVWTSDVYMQTRESKARWDGVRWRDEAAWGLDPIEIGDERLVILDLPAVPITATLTLRLLGEPHEVLVRMFREQSRTDAQRRAADRRLDPVERAELIATSTYIPWPMLPAAEQDARLVQRWLQIAAAGQGGTDFTTRTIFVTDFRAPSIAAASLDGIEVSRGHDAAINVQGPARLSLTRHGEAAGTLEVSAIGAAGTSPVAIGRDGGFDIGAAPVTLVFSTRATEPVRFTLSGPSHAQIAGAHVPAAVSGQLVPDHVRIPLVVTGPATVVSARIRDLPRTPLLGHGLRVDARVITAFDEPVVTTVTVTYLAANGRRLGGDRVTVGGVASEFERLAFGPTSAMVTEPTSFRVLAPEGTARVDLTANRDVALRLYRWAPGSETLEEPYRTLPVGGNRWRYARLVERSWFPMLPSNHELLAASARLGLLDAQVRLEPTGPARAPLGIADYVPLIPLGKPEQQTAREPVPPDELAAVISAWPRGSLTRLAAGTTRAIGFPPTLLARPRLSWITEPAAVGGELVVTIDGERTRVPITSTRGAADLPRIAPGPHEVRIDGAAGALWIDRPPADGGGNVVHDRTLYALGLEGLRVQVRQRPGEEVHVYAILYADRAAASTSTSVVMTVDGRRPMRRPGVTGQLTVPDVRVPIPAARRNVPAVLVDLAGRSAGLPRSVGIGLLGDLVPTVHEIDLNRIGGLRDEPLWVRFVTTQRARDGAESAKQWSTRSGPKLEVIDE